MTEITTPSFASRRTAVLSGCLATVLVAGALPGLAAASHHSPSAKARAAHAKDCDARALSALLGTGPAGHQTVSWRQPLAFGVVRLSGSLNSHEEGSSPVPCGVGGKPPKPPKPTPKPTPTPTPTPSPTPTPTPSPTPKPGGNPSPAPAPTPTPTQSSNGDKPKGDPSPAPSGDKPQGNPTPTTDSGAQTPPPSADSTSPSAPSSGPLPAKTTPTAGRTLNLGPATGSVRVKLLGSDTYVELSRATTVPMGSTIDARHGTVKLTDVRRADKLQTATFWGGVFTVAQHRSAHELTEVRLAGSQSCRPVGRLSATTASRHHHVRSLWGHDSHGRFSTRGNSAVATVRGTTWLTQDTCAGTRVKVRRGVVAVRDLHRHRTVIVHAGHSYLAHARHRDARA